VTLLLFDCDGVLVDSELMANAALAELISALGHPMTTQQAIDTFTGRSLRDVLATAETLLSRPIPADLSAQAGRRLLERFRRELKAVVGMREAIAALDYPRCVASSSTRERIALSLEVTGLASMFGANVFSADQVAHGKPAPDLYLAAAQAMGAAPAHCIVIEDSPLGIQAALAADMQAIGFVGASHATARLAEQLVQAGAAIVIRTASDLPAAVRRLART
jgi:HAD superfamily hydrolase (TIGR01509 family)